MKVLNFISGYIKTLKMKIDIPKKELVFLSKLNVSILKHIHKGNLNSVNLIRRRKQEVKDKYKNEGE